MNESGIYPNRPHKKSAWTVGEVIGKYHPHNDSAVYEAMVRPGAVVLHAHAASSTVTATSATSTATARRPCVTPRAARQSPPWNCCVTCRRIPSTGSPTTTNHSPSPVALPARFPNLLVNGSQGIAVGMATNIAPHNLTEAIEATCHLIDNPDATVDELMQIMPGPDFPTGAIIMGSAGIKQTTRPAAAPYRACQGMWIHQDRSQPGSLPRFPTWSTRAPCRRRSLNSSTTSASRASRICAMSPTRRASVWSSGSRRRHSAGRAQQPVQLYLAADDLWRQQLALVNGVPKCLSLREMLQH